MNQIIGYASCLRTCQQCLVHIFINKLSSNLSSYSASCQVKVSVSVILNYTICTHKNSWIQTFHKSYSTIKEDRRMQAKAYFTHFAMTSYC